MKAVIIPLFLLFSVGFIVIRELTAPSVENVIEAISEPILRELWDHTDNLKVKEACDGVTFKRKPKTAVDPIMNSIKHKRRDEQPLKKLIDNNEGKDDTDRYMDLIKTLYQYCIPWLVLFVLSIIGVPFLCCYNYGYYCCCSCCCGYPRKESGMCCRLFLITFFFACIATLLGITIAGTYYSATLTDKYDEMKCSIYLFLNEALSGSSEYYSLGYTWYGPKNVLSMVDNAIDDVKNSGLNNLTGTKVVDVIKFTSAIEFLDELSSKYSNKDIVNPKTGDNTKISLFKLSNDEASALKPIYVESKAVKDEMVPSMTKLLEDIDKGVNNQLDEMRESLNNVNDYLDQIESFKNDVENALDDADDPVEITKYSIVAYFVIILVFVCISAISVLFYWLFKMTCFKCLSNFACSFLGIAMVVGFLVAAVLFPGTVVVIEACDMIDLENINDSHEIIPDDAWKEVEVCLVGDGNLYTKYGVNETMSLVNNTAKNMDYVDVYLTDNNQVKLPVTDETMLFLKSIAEEKPYQANSEIFKNISKISDLSCMDDTFVWHKNECSASAIIISDASTNPDNGACFPIINFIDETDSDNYINNRYSSCADAATKLKRYINYATTVKTEFNNLIKELNRSDTENTYYNLMDSGFVDSNIKKGLIGIKDAREEMRSSILKLDQELEPDLNCKLLKTSFKRLHMKVCGNFTQRLTFLGLFSGLMSAVLVIMITLLIIIHRKLNPLPRTKTLKKFKPLETADTYTEINTNADDIQMSRFRA